METPRFTHTPARRRSKTTKKKHSTAQKSISSIPLEKRVYTHPSPLEHQQLTRSMALLLVPHTTPPPTHPPVGNGSPPTPSPRLNRRLQFWRPTWAENQTPRQANLLTKDSFYTAHLHPSFPAPCLISYHIISYPSSHMQRRRSTWHVRFPSPPSHPARRTRASDQHQRLTLSLPNTRRNSSSSQTVSQSNQLTGGFRVHQPEAVHADQHLGVVAET